MKALKILVLAAAVCSFSSLAADNASKDIVFIPLLDIHYCFVASKEYLNYFNKVFPNKPDYFAYGNLLLLNKKNSMREIIDKIFEKNNIIPRQILEMNNLELLIDLAKNNVGIAAVVKEFVKEDLENKTLIEIPINLKIPKHSVGFAYNKTNITKELNDFLSTLKMSKS